ncbi:helix-turn-helix domain-containing protein [Granulicella arctica]|uniref:AraC-like DNA-binding protein n=1 Tax=Granulicella arctica TaxID=940613 RepID=A0A7Y9TSI1_9BACT|nr:AraC family transcriptional regulator [Granulicella arctica]NYF79033.1 AraC-like DNA-binding protein [Granulicella arctica]
MPKDVQSHLRLPIESRLGTLDVFPFHIWRNEERMELGIVPADGESSGLHLGETLLFRCALSAATSHAISGRLPDVASGPTEVLELHIHRTLLNTSNYPLLSLAGRPFVDIDDAVIGELAVAVLTPLPVGNHNSYTTACITKMLCARLSHLLGTDEHTSPGGFEDWQLSALMEALDESTDECPSVAQIARRCRLSVCHFSRLFKAKFGMPLHRYRVNRRIKEAKSRLVDSSDPISQIALDCGFADQSSFTRRFTAVSGVSPGIWRRQSNHESALCAVQGCLSRFANA